MITTVIAITMILSAIMLVRIAIVIDAIIAAVITLTTNRTKVISTMILETRSAMDVSWLTMDLMMMMTVYVVIMIEVQMRMCSTIAMIDSRSIEVEE